MAVLAALRVLPAVAVLAANGRDLPLLPEQRYGPPVGDAYGYHAAARELIAVWPGLPAAALALLAALVAAGVAGCALLWRRRRTAEAVVLASLVLGSVLAVGIHHMSPPGAPTAGWPIVWAIALLPLRAAGMLSFHGAYYIGIAVSLACNVVTVVATALIARRLVPGWTALVAPSLLVAWPFAMQLLRGTDEVYGSWTNDTGLALYSEPLSTALVATALAFVVLRDSDALAGAAAGALLGAAIAVRLSNVTVLAVVLLWLVLRRRARPVVLCAMASLGGVAVSLVYWRYGYPSFREQMPDVIFSWNYVLPSWRESAVFGWKVVILLLAPAVLGLVTLWREAEARLLAAVVGVTAVFYSFYFFTALHPRFLFVALPSLFVLAAAGVERTTRLRARPSPAA